MKHSGCGVVGLYLDVLTSACLVVTPTLAGQWGSVFLTSFGEQDIGLNKGGHLVLDHRRVDLLYRQWLDHRLDEVLRAARNG
jgi:hypothetical protein